MLLRQLPNVITLVNLICGVCAILSVIQGDLWLTSGLLAIGLLADLLDGAVARALKVTSELGKQLDSLADLVSFGVVPGLICMLLIEQTDTLDVSLRHLDWWWIGVVIPICSAIRLARFNLIEAQSFFTGVPTPANAIWVLSLWWVSALGELSWLDSPFLFIGLTIFSGIWLLLPVKLLSFKIQAGGWKANLWPLLLLLGSGLILFFGRLEASPLVFLWYLVLSLVRYYAYHSPKP